MPLGFVTNEEQVNTTATGNQRAPAMAALPGGGYVTVWASDTGDGSGKAILAQIYDANGNKVGGEFLVNTTTAGNQDLPDVAPVMPESGGPIGGFVVVWQSEEGGGSVIRGRRFNEDGTATRFLDRDANSPTTDVLVSGSFGGSKPAVGAISAASNRMAIVWEAPSGDGDGTAIMMARYRVQFALSSPEVVNTTTAGNQHDPRVSSGGTGVMAIVWESQEASGDVIRARATNISFNTADYVVNETAGQDESLPNVTLLSDGSYMAIWNSGTNIEARRLGQFQTPLGASVVLNSTPGGGVDRSDLTALPNGEFIVSYFTYDGDDGSSYSIRAERFSTTGGTITSLSNEFFVPQNFAFAQSNPNIVQLTGGNIVVAWSSEAGQIGNFEVKQRLLNLDAPAGTSGDDVINGTEGPDVLSGLGGNDTINGLGGNDLIDGGPGDDVMDGGADTDTVTYASATGPVTVTLASTTAQSTVNAGSDTLSNFENLTGSPYADTLTGDGNVNVIDGGGGADAMAGGDGSDTYVVDQGDGLGTGDTITENPGEGVADGVRTGVATYTIPVYVENLTATNIATHDFRGNSAGNVVTGGGGRDIIRLQDGGADTANGDEGDDTFYYGATFDSADAVNGGGGADAIILQGDYSAGVTLALSGVANVRDVESLSLAPGNYTAYGDPGTGSYSYNLTTHEGNVAAGAILKINAFLLRAGENLTFNGAAEGDGRFMVLAGQGIETLTGGSQGDLFIFGHDGRFGAGDTVTGGGGYDSVYLRGDYAIDFNAVGFTAALAGIESVTLAGSSDVQFVAGGDGEFDYAIVWNDDLLAGGTITFNGSRLGAAETMAFDGGDEASAAFHLWGGSAADTLAGGDGDDLLFGGVAADTLTGNGGGDIFRYHLVTESTALTSDTIADFTAGDRIDLSVIDAVSGTPAQNDAFTFIDDDAFSLGQGGQLRAENVPSTNNWLVQADVDGNGTIDFQVVVTVSDSHTLTGADFVL
jgi:Ca2+-binding RTX toxin-like protein